MPILSVMITGASSGIGRASTLYLAQRGVQVFAGVRNQKDGDELVSIAGELVVPVHVDVTNHATVAAAVDQVRASLCGRGLDALVNNAGIGLTAPIEYVDLQSVRQQFEVNVFGQIAVTQAFLPLIRRAKGRVIMIGSVGGHITLPFVGILSGSKSALGSVSDALRLELHPFGIRVCVIEPASIHTAATEKTLGNVERVIAELPPAGREQYGAMLRRFNARAYAREKKGSPPEVVASAVYEALTATHPKSRYPVGKDARLLTLLPRIAPDRLLDMLRLKLFGLPGKFGARTAV